MRFNASRYPVNFLGKVSHKELYKIYQDSCMFVLSSYYESFGLVALEAMSCGRPVVGFSDTSLSEVVSKRAGIFVRRNTREFARAVNFLLNNKSKRYDFGRKASERASAFNWEIISRRYIEFYGKIVKEYSGNYGFIRIMRNSLAAGVWLNGLRKEIFIALLRLMVEKAAGMKTKPLIWFHAKEKMSRRKLPTISVLKKSGFLAAFRRRAGKHKDSASRVCRSYQEI